MNNFDNLFFRAYTWADSEIREVFHRHAFVIIEDILIWIFFGIIVPGFLYGQDIFSIRTNIPPMYSYIYMSIVYMILMYKLFDWYVDTWIMTESTIVDMKWKWLSSDLLYIPYSKIEWVEIRTRSWWAALLGMSDVVVKLAWSDEFTLYSARKPSAIIAFIQEVGKDKKKHEDDKREPFDILVDSLSSVVKWHLDTHGKNYITTEYVEKLDETITRGIPIDLRTKDEKILIANWKEKYTKKDEHTEDDEWSRSAH
jgi:hypothetical protein